MNFDTWELVKICGIVVVCGGVGGVTGGLYNKKCSKAAAIESWLDVLVFFLCGFICAFGFILMCGVLSVLLNSATDMYKTVFLIGISLLTGFFAFRLLPHLGSRLEARVTDVERKAKETEEKIENTMEYNRLLSIADTALNTKDKQDVETAIGYINESLRLFPIDRPLHIYLGRLYREQGSLDDAIFLLRKFIKKRLERKNSEGLNSGDKEALATAFFNISCYHCLKAQDVKNNSLEEKRLLDEALVALEEVEEYDFSLAKAALIDQDMELLKKRNPDYFKKYS